MKIKFIMYNVQDDRFPQLYVRVDILLTCGKHLHDCVTSPRGHPKTSLLSSRVRSQESERQCI